MGKFKILLPPHFLVFYQNAFEKYLLLGIRSPSRAVFCRRQSQCYKGKKKNERVDDVVVVVECIDNFYKLCVLNGIS